VIIAPALSPLIGSLVVNKHSWQNIYWIVLGLGGLQLLMFLLLVPETLWNEDPDQRGSDVAMGDDRDGVVVVRQGRVGPAWFPWRRPKDFATLFTRPIAMASQSPLSKAQHV
jgi:MFS family permease